MNREINNECLVLNDELENNSVSPLANAECSVLNYELKDNSSLIIQNLSLGEAAQLKEIQR